MLQNHGHDSIGACGRDVVYKDVEDVYKRQHIYNAIGSYNYGAMYRLVYGTLLYRNGTNLVLKTKVVTALGQTDKIEIADFSGYNVLFIDETTNRIYVPTEDDLLAEQSAGEAASTVSYTHLFSPYTLFYDI